MKEIIKSLDNATGREEAREILKGLSIAELREIAKTLHIKPCKREDLETKIVEGTTGVKLRFNALMNIEL